MQGNTLQNDRLVQSVLQGRLDFFRSASEGIPLPGSGFQEISPDTFYYASGIDYAPCNGILEEDDDRVPSNEFIDQTIAFFNSRKLPFIWWTGQKILENKGFQLGGVMSGVAVDLSKGVPYKGPIESQCTIKIAQTEADVEAFSKMICSQFSMGPNSAEQYKVPTYLGMQRGEQVHFMAYINDILVGVATLTTGFSTSGVYNLATLAGYRNQGVATALVHATLVEAHKRGYTEASGILMPKGMAMGVAMKLGFVEVSHFPFYMYGVSPNELEK